MTHVSLAQCKKITDRGISALIRASAGRLIALSLENCHHTTNAALFALAETHCTGARDLHCFASHTGSHPCLALAALVDLDLSGCDAVTDEGLQAIIRTSTALEGLSVEELTELSEEGISFVSRLHSLKRLRYG
jgi:bacterioferritin-associated ferredoxin